MTKPNINQLVRFTIPAHRLRKSASEQDMYRKLIEEVFDVCLGRSNWEDVTFICRLDQFGLFLVRRHEMGIQNQYAELNVSLVAPADKATVFDVSDK